MAKLILQLKDLDCEALVAQLRAGDKVVLMDGDRGLSCFLPEAQDHPQGRPLPRFGSLRDETAREPGALKGRITLD